MFSFFSKKVLHKFIEGVNNEDVVWYEDEYEAVRDGVGHTGSPEVQSHLETVRKAIETPDQVKKDKDYADRLCYYAWFSGDIHYPNNHMKVVLVRLRNGKLKVVTAYFTNSFKAGEKEIWTK